jgi:hypothetical protein
MTSMTTKNHGKLIRTCILFAVGATLAKLSSLKAKYVNSSYLSLPKPLICLPFDLPRVGEIIS